jgi:hypothetical protein
MLTELGLKLIEVGGGSTGGSKAGGGATLAGGNAGTPGAKAAAAKSPAPPTDGSPGAAPAGMTAAVVGDGDEDSTDSFHCDGDEDGVTFEDAIKPNTSISSYPPSSPSPSCCRVSLEAFSPGLAGSVIQSVDDIVLPLVLVQLLLKAIPTTSSGTPFHLVVADAGATDHMVPDRGAFISYKSVQCLRVRMGNNSFAPVLGPGTVIISLNG